MGYRIALTGLVIFVFFLALGRLAKKPPEQPGLVKVSVVLMLIGMLAFPVGLIIGIWE